MDNVLACDSGILYVPDGVDEASVRRQLLNNFSIEIGAGLGELKGDIWRIGLMGYSCNPKNVITVLSALEQILVKEGAKINEGVAVKAATDHMDKENVLIG